MKFEYYDFSEPAQKFFGNDIAWTITVPDLDKLLSIVNQDEASLITWIEQCLKSYFAIKQWLEENKIEYRIERESCA